MRNKNLMMGALVLSVALVATGCAKPPQTELDAAKASMDAASAEAQKYAADSWVKAQDAMNAVNAELEAQTAVDSTTEAPRPLGQRGARKADELGAVR